MCWRAVRAKTAGSSPGSRGAGGGGGTLSRCWAQSPHLVSGAAAMHCGLRDARRFRGAVLHRLQCACHCGRRCSRPARTPRSPSSCRCCRPPSQRRHRRRQRRSRLNSRPSPVRTQSYRSTCACKRPRARARGALLWHDAGVGAAYCRERARSHSEPGRDTSRRDGRVTHVARRCVRLRVRAHMRPLSSRVRAAKPSARQLSWALMCLLIVVTCVRSSARPHGSYSCFEQCGHAT